MTRLWLIIGEEWRYWRRSRLASAAFTLACVLLITTTGFTWAAVDAAQHRRNHLQETAEAAFLDQPDRHPHRMVHYGHYAFRTPALLATLDPGVDPYAGIGIFLEGHRQNSAMFAEAGELPTLARFGLVSPALTLQVLAPLLIVLMGFASIGRERDAGTLLPLSTQGVTPGTLALGKALALGSVVLALLLPVTLAGIAISISNGESLLAPVLWTAAYGVYLAVWVALTVAVSAWVPSTSASLAVLVMVWLTTVMVIPRLAGTSAATAVPIPGKIATDLAMLTRDSALNDGHNANDPGFAQLRANILAQYGVNDIAELPINYRGITAQQAEADLTAELNRYAEERMAAERRQSAALDRFGWLSPTLLVRRASMAIAGTDLAHHHRFLREAEALRFDFVQSLNRVHAEQLSYADDIQRSVDPGAEQRTRVSAANWALLNDFSFTVSPLDDRLAEADATLLALLAWLLMGTGLLGLARREIRP